MNLLLKLHLNYYPPRLFQLSKTGLHPHTLSRQTHFISPSHDPKTDISWGYTNSKRPKASTVQRPAWSSVAEQRPEEGDGYEYLAKDGEVFQKTLRLVETAMFASVSGLAYLLSNSLAVENYFGCFFALPIVISSLRWGVAAGRKTMVATVVLLFVLSGPVKAINYMLMHGLLGLTMGSLWRLRANWTQSIFLCALVLFPFPPV
ncbi:unnamed protein product [Cuscuta campestris]|uniref:Uncharacterized protein n=1 Tax=Cuscuta campestris TaxID=132261 RepID=A0A484N512_9ASTE|nr:unnamed protein product [Cuscuta campestris]